MLIMLAGHPGSVYVQMVESLIVLTKLHSHLLLQGENENGEDLFECASILKQLAHLEDQYFFKYRLFFRSQFIEE